MCQDCANWDSMQWSTWSTIDLGFKIVICPFLNQLEFSLDILLINLTLFNLKAMGYLQKQCKLSQLLQTRPGWVRILSVWKGIHFKRNPFRKGKFQKVKILNIFWCNFKDHAKHPSIPKSWNPWDQTRCQIQNNKQQFKFFIQNLRDFLCLRKVTITLGCRAEILA